MREPDGVQTSLEQRGNNSLDGCAAGGSRLVVVRSRPLVDVMVMICRSLVMVTRFSVTGVWEESFNIAVVARCNKRESADDCHASRAELFA